MSGMDSDSFRIGKKCRLCNDNQPCKIHGRTPVTDADFEELHNEMRLHLDESLDETELTITAKKEEWQALMNWLEREFIPHDNYEEIHNVLKTINGKLAR